MDATENRLKALDAFKDWSNYLLVTTVAALGWTAEKGNTTFKTEWMEPAAVLCFALSIIFAILTLALVPHVAEGLGEAARKNKEEDKSEPLPSIYQVYWDGWWIKNLRLTRLCLIQHVFFLIGIIFYAAGKSLRPPRSCCWSFGVVVMTLVGLFVLGQISRTKGKITAGCP